jgi:hypothetical protein
MNKFLLLTLVASALAGCNSDQVGIQQIAPPKPSSQNAPGVEGSTQKNSATLQNGGPQTVYFNQIRLEDGSVPMINGIGFLASNSNTQEPFVFGLPSMLPLGSQFMSPNLSGLTLLTNSNKQSELDLVNVTTLHHQKIGGMNNALSFVSDTNGRITTWVDESGEAFVQNASNTFSKLNLGTQKAAAVVSGGPILNFVLTSGLTSSALAVNVETATITNTFQATAVSTSPNGTRTLLLNPGKPAQIYDWTTDKSSTLSLKDEINEPSWKNESLFAYWTETENGLALKTFDLLTQTNKLVAELNLSDKENGIVCPIWIGSSLYYGDQEGLSYAIERADVEAAATGGWKTTDFATSAESRFGFVCPQALTSNGVTQ